MTWLWWGVGLALVALMMLSMRRMAAGPEPIIAFLQAHPERSAVVWLRNDTVMASLRGQKKFPLASTVKIIVAIEFAQQVAAGKLNPEAKVPLRDLDVFYLPNTDGNAHPSWKKALESQGLIVDEAVPLLEVAKGMIHFSSNANTEYLMDRLGLDNINANLPRLGLNQHDPLYPIVGALFLHSKDPKVPTEVYAAELRSLDMATYRQKALALHEKLKNDEDLLFKKKFIFPGMELQKIWSDRLPAATAAEYASLLGKINRRDYFPGKVHKVLDAILEWPMVVNPGNREIYKHLGQKGGSTAFVLTMATYLTSKRDNRTEIVVFFNDLLPEETNTLRNSLNDFLIACSATKSSKEVAAQLGIE